MKILIFSVSYRRSSRPRPLFLLSVICLFGSSVACFNHLNHGSRAFSLLFRTQGQSCIMAQSKASSFAHRPLSLILVFPWDHARKPSTLSSSARRGENFVAGMGSVCKQKGRAGGRSRGTNLIASTWDVDVDTPPEREDMRCVMHADRIKHCILNIYQDRERSVLGGTSVVSLWELRGYQPSNRPRPRSPDQPCRRPLKVLRRRSRRFLPLCPRSPRSSAKRIPMSSLLLVAKSA